MRTVDIIGSNGSVETVSENDPRIVADRALDNAIRQIAQAQHRGAGSPTHSKPGKRAFVAVGENVRRLVTARSEVLSGKITPEQAMAIVLEPDVFQSRFPHK